MIKEAMKKVNKIISNTTFGNIIVVIAVIIALCFCLWISPVWWIKDFMYGYKIGYNSAEDLLVEFDLAGHIQPYGHYTEGIFDYWDKMPYFYQQGYEEGFKSGTENYVKECWKSDR